jgi:plastocyanin
MVDQFVSPNWHIILIHYPLGLVGAGVLLELVALVWPRGELRATARIMVVLGGLLAIPTALAGIHALRDVLVPGPAGAERGFHSLVEEAGWTDTQWHLISDHIWFNSLGTAAALLAIGLWCGLSREARRWGYVASLVLLLVALGLFSGGAWYGGEAVYTTGVGVETEGVSDARSGLSWYVPPLQLHVVLAGFTAALGAWGVFLLLASRRRPGAPAPATGVPGLLLDAPVPVRAGPPAAGEKRGVGAWSFAVAAAVLTILAGLWAVIGGPGGSLGNNLEVLASGTRWRLALHVLVGLTVLVLAIVLALAARRRSSRPGLSGLLAAGLVLALALQVWLGILMLFDSHRGPLTGFQAAPPPQKTAEPRQRAADVSAERAAATVRMTDRLTYEPEAVTIAVGETVVWENTSAVVHTVTADEDEAADPSNVRLPDGAEPFDSGDIPPGESWSYRFTVAGEYRYFCIPHEMADMIGTVTVQP